MQEERAWLKLRPFFGEGKLVCVYVEAALGAVVIPS